MKSVLAWIVLTGLAIATTSCSPQAKGTETPKKPNEVLTNVKVRTVEPDSLTETISLTGTVLADRDVTFAAETPGRVEKLAVDLGDRVRKGQLLARIDYQMLKAQHDQARASYELANKTQKRLAALTAEKLASQQQLDEVQTHEQSARAALQIAEVQLRRSVVRSTISGIVARKRVDEGEYVNPGQPLIQVVDFRTVVISAQVPENLVARIERDMPVRVYVDSLGRELEGKVQVVVPAAHPTSKTFELRVKAPNPKYDILIGMSAGLRITAQVHRDAVVVPLDTVVEAAGVRAVFVERDGKVQRRVVELGPIDRGRVLIKKGLAPGDRQVVEGQRNLYDGQSVRVVPNRAIATKKSAGTPIDPS